MKKLIITIMTGALLCVASGCTSTVTLGPKANESEVLGAGVGTNGANLTLPLVRGSVKTDYTPEEKK